MSLLLDAGHPDAWVYPIGLVMLEADLVVERQSAAMGFSAQLMQMAVSSIPNMGVKPESTKSIGKAFAALVKRLIGDA